MELGNLVDAILQEGRSRGDWRRLVGIVLTLLFVFFSSVKRSRSKTLAREDRAAQKAQRAYAPIEASGFPLWAWWGFLLATAFLYVTLLPHFPSVMERVVMAGVALALLGLLRVLGGRADNGHSPAADLLQQEKQSVTREEGEPWTPTTRGST